MLLIYPPAAKLSEPPPGIARLAGALHAHGIDCNVIDANLEGALYLLRYPQQPDDTWTKRAVRMAPLNIEALRIPFTYRNKDRYKRVVNDLQRVLRKSSEKNNTVASLSNYEDNFLSPVRSSDLITAYNNPDRNPFYNYFSEKISTSIEKTKPSLVGFSLTFLSQALTTFAMAGFIRKQFPDVGIVLGGGLVTSWMRNPDWINPFKGIFDLMVAGPGEKVLLDLLGIKNPSAHYGPEYGGLPLSDYLSPGLVLPYSASSGCYWNHCSFCPERAERNPYTHIPVPAIHEEITRLVSIYNPALIHFTDNAMSPALLRLLIRNPPGVPWYGFVRFSEDLVDRKFCTNLKQAGCVLLKIGLESGDQYLLNSLDKGISLRIASQALNTLAGAGIETYVYLLFGTPRETAAKARKTMDFVISHHDAIHFLNIAIFNMPIHSSEAIEYHLGDFYEGDLSLYTDFLHPHGWGRKEIRNFLDREFKRHPLISPIIRNDPPHFTCNHAPFFVMEKYPRPW